MADSKRNIRVGDPLWDRLHEQAARHRRSVAGEVRVALEVYATLAERDDDVIEEVLNASDQSVSRAQ